MLTYVFLLVKVFSTSVREVFNGETVKFIKEQTTQDVSDVTLFEKQKDNNINFMST